MHDVRFRKESAAYVQVIIRHAKAADIDSVKNQLIFAYQGIAAELRAFVDPPGVTTTVAQFIQTLELKKDTWFEMNSYRSLSHTNQKATSTHQPQQQRGGYRFSNSNSSNYRQPLSSIQPQQPSQSQSQYRPFGQNTYQSQQQSYGQQPYGQQYGSRAAGPSMPSRQPLQITAPPNQSTYDSKPSPSGLQNRYSNQKPGYQGNQGFQGKSWQPNNAYRPKAAAYQASMKEGED